MLKEVVQMFHVLATCPVEHQHYQEIILVLEVRQMRYMPLLFQMVQTGKI